MPDEILDLVNPDTGAVIGQAPRSRCHGNPALCHRAVHAVVVHPDGRILLQKRSASKQIQPGKWDTAVGGHVSAGETVETALLRETAEEIGLTLPLSAFHFLFSYRILNKIESELVSVYKITSEGPFHFPKDEIDELAFFSPADLSRRLRDGLTDDLTPVLQRELAMLPGFLK